MATKRKGPAPHLPDEEVLKAVRELPQTMKSRFHLRLKVDTVAEALERCFGTVGCKRGQYPFAHTRDNGFFKALAVDLIEINDKLGFILSCPRRTGKTWYLFMFMEFFNLLKNFPDAWEYQEVNSLDCKYVRAENFRYPFASWASFQEALKAPILFLDNLGYEEAGTHDRLAKELIQTLIKTRSDCRLLTFIATPYDFETLMEAYGEIVVSCICDDYLYSDFD